jgi:hypothetical protein
MVIIDIYNYTFVRNTTRSGSARPGASGAPGHVREDPRCSHEVLRGRELRRGGRDSSPSAPPSVVLELRLDSGFAADACYLCRRVHGSEGTSASTGAGPARIRAATVCSTRRRYFQWTIFSTNGCNYCGFVIILYSNRTGRLPPIPTIGPRLLSPPLMYRQPTF